MFFVGILSLLHTSGVHGYIKISVLGVFVRILATKCKWKKIRSTDKRG